MAAAALQGTGGECGLRGGYVEMTNIHPGTIEQIYKCASINLCPNTIGQVSCLATHPSRHQTQGDSLFLWLMSIIALTDDASVRAALLMASGTQMVCIGWLRTSSAW
jgi:hypothetical protein